MSLLFDVIKKAQGKSTDKVDEVTRIVRLEKCRDCPNLKLGLNCGLCGCFVSDKTKYKAESCPAGFWKEEL